MIRHDCEQGGLEWMELRLGRPTMSQADRLVTPSRLKPSGAQATYRAELLAEWLLGQPLDWGSTEWMDRGRELEPRARSYYEFTTDRTVETVGFLTDDDALVGGSPDGLVGTDGIIEIKCLEAKGHVLAMLGEVDGHKGQCQGYLWLTGRKWVDMVFFNPTLPSVIHRIERDEDHIEALATEAVKFAEALEADKERLAEHKVVRPWHPEMQAELQGVA